MSAEADVRTYLLSQTDLTDQIGQRLHFDEIPESTGLDETLLLISLASGPHGDFLDGTPRDLQFPNYSFECRAATKSRSIDLATVVRRALQAVSTGIAGTSVECVTVKAEADGSVEVVNENGESVVLKTRILTVNLGVRYDVTPTT